jgi:type II secretory pathway pseudopilin PulG
MAKRKTTHVGIAINTEWVELIQLAKDLKTIEKSVKLPMPMATMDPSGDRLRDPQTLATSIAAMLAELGNKAQIKSVHVTVPGTLVRIVEMPKIPKNELILALTSEAERYAVFNDTEALVDYEVISEEPDERQKIILVALRKDTVAAYKEAFDMAKIKVASLEVETISSLRGLKYSGSLDAALAEVGDQPWGSIHFEPERIRISVWHYDQIKNWREVLLDTSDLKIMGEDAPVIQDLVEEVRRTIGMTRPALWLTYGIPESLATSLTPRLGANVRPMLAGNAIRLDDPKLSLSAIGISCKSFDSFPAYIDVKPAVDPESSGELLGSFKIMLAAAGVLAVLSVAATLILMLATFIFSGQLKNRNQEIAQQTSSISVLQEEVNRLQKKASVDRELADRVTRVIKKNQSISKITDAIKNRIPANLWLETVTISGDVRVEGRSIDYDSIIEFSKNFDRNETIDGTESPLTNMAVENIEEIKEEGVKVYKFTMVGHPKI